MQRYGNCKYVTFKLTLLVFFCKSSYILLQLTFFFKNRHTPWTAAYDDEIDKLVKNYSLLLDNNYFWTCGLIWDLNCLTLRLQIGKTLTDFFLFLSFFGKFWRKSSKNRSKLLGMNGFNKNLIGTLWSGSTLLGHMTTILERVT